MNKVFGITSDFTPVREEGTRIVISYNMVDEGNGKVSWIEIYLPKKQNSSILSFGIVKEAIIADIDATTDKKILCGFKWNDNDGVERNVWLNAENQRNYSEAQRLADKAGAKNYEAQTFKISEDENHNAFYKTFSTLAELNEFYYAAFAYIKQCLAEGWAQKDSFDFSPYEACFPTVENGNNSVEE